MNFIHCRAWEAVLLGRADDCKALQAISSSLSFETISEVLGTGIGCRLLVNLILH